MRKGSPLKMFRTGAAFAILVAAVMSPAGRSAAGQSKLPAAKPFLLTVDSIMRGPDLVGYPPTGLRWSGDSERLYFEWRKPGEDEASTYVVARAGGSPRKLSDDERKLAPADNARWDRARRRALAVDNGDIVMVDSVAGTRRWIARTSGSEANPRWARNDTHVTFTRDGNLFIVPIAAGEGLIQLTDVAVKKPDPKLTESQKFLKEEEQKLIDFVKEQAEKKKKDEARRERDALPKVELKEGQSALDLSLSPDDVHVFIVVAEKPQGAKTADVPNYVTESSYSEMIPARTNVGDVQEKRLLAILNLKTKKTVWADSSFAPEGDPKITPTGNGNGDPKDKKPSREVRWAMPSASGDGKQVVAAARSTDNKDRWIVLLDPESGKTQVVDRLTDEAWIRELGPGGGFGSGVVEFLPDNRTIWFLSERDGWMHLYSLDVTAARPEAKPLTSGKWEITSADLSTDRSRFYITSTEVHPGERHLFTMPATGGARTRITTMTGSSQAEVSPDDSTLGVVFSYSNKPPEVYVMPNRAGARAVQVTTTPTEEWRSFKWADPQLVTFKARDGVDVFARLYTPEMMGAKRDPSRPGVVFVHGAGYLQNAHRYWASYFREYMFHNLLAARGYVVLDVDYRASSGYGRDWRTAIYRHMGGKDLEDIVDGAKYLVSAERVDPKRIGVYGGSYGGFITLMAMFTTPDVFAAGAALRPVTDWAHYNHGYTSNILNEPHKDAEAYRRSSPIYFAQNLKGALLICHGMVDTNVHVQDSVRLAQRLIELRKENWELAVYPVENHAFTEETSWADEYKRILKLFEENLRGQ
ncbi:MAG TPA: S9 family peptidase [Vicinamibacterales bacterium]|jgi:dipeptidyl aminopeptidase/acylaminoacyl peptidase|nr:S9 family peptidase [Vicinamibacterales bacterium]